MSDLCQPWPTPVVGVTDERQGYGSGAQDRRRVRAPYVLLWSALACCPFWLFQAEHFLRFEGQATGFILFDMAYYPANGREIFERGNGFGYCNPYDPDPAAPVIYYHWLQWIFGVGVNFLGVDPGVWFLLVGGVGSLATAVLTFKLVEAVLPTPRYIPALFLVVMWGGGGFVLTAAIENLVWGKPLASYLLRYDPGVGWWCLNWGRSMILPTEAVYHAFVAGSWLAVACGHPWAAVAAVGGLAATHPFSGVQHLIIIGAWLSWCFATRRAYGWPLIATIGMSMVFLSYYFLYLPSFPQHSRIHEDWSLEWNLPVVSMLCGYLPVALLAAARIWNDRKALHSPAPFLLIAAGVSFLLVHHNWLFPARQPLHFTRGYVWMPLCLLGLPLVQRWLCNAAEKGGDNRMVLAAVLGFGFAVSDNTVWLMTVPRDPVGMHGQVKLPPDVRNAFRVLDSTAAKGVVLVVVPGAFDSNCLAATYTALVPFIGHPFLTPDYDARVEAAMLWERTGRENELFQSINVIIIAKQALASSRPYDFSGWTPIHENDTVIVLRRGAR